MRDYYLHNGFEQLGPFTIDELKEQNINKETPVWYKGLARWTAAENIDEIKGILNVLPQSTMIQHSFPKEKPFEKEDSELVNKQKKESRIYMLLILLVLFLALGYLFLIYKSSSALLVG